LGKFKSSRANPAPTQIITKGKIRTPQNFTIFFSRAKRTYGVHIAIHGCISTCYAYDGATVAWRCGAHDNGLFDRLCYSAARMGAYQR